jgi:NAD(P)-dependent dehydrogenase (short-subunit alcohol dehydrogenase family)
MPHLVTITGATGNIGTVLAGRLLQSGVKIRAVARNAEKLVPLTAKGAEARVGDFSHLPLDNGSMLGNFYFEKAVPNGAHYAEGAAARDIIERSGKVIACLAGHTHWNARNTIDGVHYITIHSLTESFTTHPYPTGAFGVLDIDAYLTVEVFGRDPALHRLPLKPLGYHWQNLHRDFAPKPAHLPPRMAARLAADRQS